MKAKEKRVEDRNLAQTREYMMEKNNGLRVIRSVNCS